MNVQPRRGLFRTILAWLIVGATISPVAGQTPAQSSFASDGFLVLVPLRTAGEIDADIAEAEGNLAQAKSNETAAISQRDGARAASEAKKQEIAAIKQRHSIAKANKNEVEVSSLALSRKALERELDLLEQRESLRAAEIDLARNTGELAAMARRALAFEKELAVKRLESDAVTEPGPTRSTLSSVVLNLEAQTLDARVAYADKAVDVATRLKKVAERQLKIVEARRQVLVN